ncbi:hypothetical protein ACFLRX_08715, partial [Acidobacteriota bacterium]
DPDIPISIYFFLMRTENGQKTWLSSWKEIAVYLNCGVQTCRRWEKEHDLPIHRIEGAAKSRVYASQEDLDFWLENKLNNNSNNKKTSFLFPLPSNFLRKSLFLIIPVFIIIFGYSFISEISKSPAPVKLNEANIIVSDPHENKLWIWGFDGANSYSNIMTAQPIRFMKASVDDLDNDGIQEIVALMTIKVESKEQKNQEGEDRIYPVVLKKDKNYDWKNFAKSIYLSNADYFKGKLSNGAFFKTGNVDGIPGKEVILISHGKLAVFKYDKQAAQLRLLAIRDKVIENIQLNFWNAVIVESQTTEPSKIYVSAFQVGRTERSFLLIFEMIANYPVLKRAVPSDTYTVSTPICKGDVIYGKEEEIITTKTRKIGDYYHGYIIGWNLEGDKIFDFEIVEPQLARSSGNRPHLTIAVGDITKEQGDEVVILTRLRNQPCELIVYHIEGSSLIELSRHKIDDSLYWRQVTIANLDNDSANEIFIAGPLKGNTEDNRRYFLEIFDYEEDLTSLWYQEYKSGIVRDVSVSGIKLN